MTGSTHEIGQIQVKRISDVSLTIGCAKCLEKSWMEKEGQPKWCRRTRLLERGKGMQRMGQSMWTKWLRYQRITVLCRWSLGLLQIRLMLVTSKRIHINR